MIANKDLRKAAILIEQGKQIVKQLNLQQRQNDLLSESLDMKDSIIASQVKTIFFKDSSLYLYRQISEQNKEIISGYSKQVQALNGNLKAQKRKTLLVAIVGIAVSAFLMVK